MGSPRIINVAACAPRGSNIGPRWANPETVIMIAGKQKDPAKIEAHIERFLTHHVNLLEKVGAGGADVAVFCEDCLRLCGMISKQKHTKACQRAIKHAYEQYVQRIGEVCRRHEMAIIGGTMTTRRGKYYNTAVMIDPEGKVIATYDKTHLPRGEAQCLTPGNDLPVFDTYLGRVGMLICWDIVFPEPFAVLALKGAEIIFEPTYGHWTEAADITARSRAEDWAVPMVVGMWNGCGVIIDAEGKFAARTGQVGDSFCMAPVNLDFKRKWTQFKDTRKQKPAGRRPELYGLLAQQAGKT